MTSSFARRTSLAACSLLTGLALVVPTAIAAPAASDSDGSYTEQRIALGGDGVFTNYRIPAIIQLNNGDILASYDGRPTATDAPGPNSIIQRRSTDGGKTWQEATVVAAGQAAEPKFGYSDPSYVYDAETGTLFNFFVYSKDTGFWNSGYGNNDEDRQVMSAAVAVSTDNGHTWELRSVTDVVKPDDVRATFATSGHGIQITRGPYKGRLVQQYAGGFRDGGVKAYSVYSDDHGDTWKMGEPVGRLMDENKVVELSDGTLMMNSRAHNTHNGRWVAYSHDGGHTWSTPEMDNRLVDPRNNASIIQMNPGAPAGSREAKELLFSNSNSTAGRSNGTVRYSCDDGKTWPVATVFEPGAMSYSDLVALDDGTYGLLYEGQNSEIRYGAFDEDWLNPFCAAFEGASAEVDAGTTTDLTFTLRNDDDQPLPAGVASAAMGNGWRATEVETPALAPGESAEVTVRVSAPVFAALGTKRGDITVKAGGYELRGDATVNVLNAAPNQVGASVVGQPGDPGRDVVANPYQVGEKVPYTFRVTSEANVVQTVAPVSGNLSPLVPPGQGNCRWGSLPVGGAYNCTTPRFEVTEDSAADGFFVPRSEWEMSAAGVESKRIEVVGDEVSLKERTPELTQGDAKVSLDDTDADGYTSAGDTATATFEIANTGNVRLTDVRVGGEVVAEELPANASVTATRTVQLTDKDLKSRSVSVNLGAVEAANGTLGVTLDEKTVTAELTNLAPAPVEPTDPAPAPVEPTDPASTSPATPGPGAPTDPSPAPGSKENAASTKTSGTLPRTGAEIAPFVIGAVLLCAAGVALLARRSRSTDL